MEQLPRLYLTREEMMKRVARFKDLKGSDGGLPDRRCRAASARCSTSSASSRRRMWAGRQPLRSATMPRGIAAIKISEGFNLGYCKAKPGHGPRCTTTTPTRPSSR